MIHMKRVIDQGTQERSASEMELFLLRWLSASSPTRSYPSERELGFELRMREATIKAAMDLNASGVGFETFEESRCNKEYWVREPNGAFRLRSDRSPAAAIRDIFQNGPLYGFECATAIVIVFYKAALETIGDRAYNVLFGNTYLFHWNVDRDLALTTLPFGPQLPGDCLYFDNPDVDPEKMEWQGENVILLGRDSYYGHGIGIHNADHIIRTLNANRRPGADRSAFLLPQATRPNYVSLAQSAAALGGLSMQSPGWPAGPLPYRATIGSGLYYFE